MNTSGELISEDLPVSPAYLCPFLGKHYDPETYSAVLELPNYCHKANPIAPVTLEHQIFACTSVEYKNCPVFMDPRPRRLPPEWLNLAAVPARSNLSWQRLLIYIGIGLVVLVAAVLIFTGKLPFFSTANLPVVQATNTPTLTLVPTDTATLTGTPTQRPTAVQTPSPDLMGTQTQDASMRTQTVSAQSILTSSPLPGDQTQAALATANGCSVLVSGPEYLPPHTDPPLFIDYGSRPFLLKWHLTNTSQNCYWNEIQLLTTVANQPKLLVMMTINRDQPLVNVEFALRDQQNHLLNQVIPGQTVILVIQISGLELWNNGGRLDQSYDLLINGNLLPEGHMQAVLDRWVTVIMPSKTSTATLTPIVVVTQISTPTVLPPP